MDRLIFCHTQLNAWVANFRDCELWYSSKLLNFSSFVARKLPLTYLVIIVTLRSQTFLFRNIYCWKISYVRYVRIAQQINRYTRTVSLKFPGIATHCHCLSGRLHLQISGHPNVWTSSFINGSLRDHADQPWELFLFQFTLIFTVISTIDILIFLLFYVGKSSWTPRRSSGSGVAHLLLVSDSHRLKPHGGLPNAWEECSGISFELLPEHSYVFSLSNYRHTACRMTPCTVEPRSSAPRSCKQIQTQLPIYELLSESLLSQLSGYANYRDPRTIRTNEVLP